MFGGTTAQLAYLILLLLAVGGWMLVEFRGRLGQGLRTAAAWGLIFVGVMAGYGLWSDIRSPMRQQAVVSGNSVEIPQAPDGHYYLTLRVNGQPVEFMVDTGATNVVLAEADARRLGIDPASLAYIGEARTANGVVRTARLRLPEVTLGPWTDRQVPAWVSAGRMDMSLLGMDYLRNYHVVISGDRMALSR